MHWVAARARPLALLVAGLLLILSVVTRLPAAADGPGSGNCNILKDPTCTVGTGSGGVPGQGSGSQPTGDQTGGGSCQNTDARDGGCNPCPATAAYGDKPPAVTEVCSIYLQDEYCYAILGDALGGLKVRSVAVLTPEQISTLNYGLAIDGCPAVITPAALAQQALATIVFPHPTGNRSPNQTQLYKGYAFTYVNLWTYYWTNSATWHPLTATASTAGLTATVTATPTSLSFDPGDGSGTQTCAGPGRPWVESDGDHPPSDGACGYQYSKVTGPGYNRPITSTQMIVWKITWTGTGNTGGEIPGLTTSTPGQLNVMQIRTVNR